MSVSACLCQRVCVSVSVSACLCQHVCVSVSVTLCLCQRVCVSVSVSACLCQCVCVSVPVSACLCQRVRVSVFVSVCQHVRFSVCVSVSVSACQPSSFCHQRMYEERKQRASRPSASCLIDVSGPYCSLQESKQPPDLWGSHRRKKVPYPLQPTPHPTPTPPPPHPYTTPTPPLHHPYTAPTPPLHHPYTAPTPPLHRPYTAPTPPRPMGVTPPQDGILPPPAHTSPNLSAPSDLPPHPHPTPTPTPPQAVLTLPLCPPQSCRPSPVALEPLASSRAAVLTLLLQLPTADDQFTPPGQSGIIFGSALVTLGETPRPAGPRVACDTHYCYIYFIYLMNI